MIRLLQDGLAASADRRPEATALVLGDERLGYGQLERRSSQVAYLLREAGCTPGDRVCVVMPKSLEAIVAILGVLKAGGVYVPVDASSPPARVARIVGLCDSRIVLAARASAGLVREAARQPGYPATAATGWLGEVPDDRTTPAAFAGRDVDGAPDGSIDPRAGPSDPAYILFTSGSTGTPKGVVITHANVAHFLDWALGYFAIGADDRLSGHPPLNFDLSVFDLFGSLTAGAELHLVPPELNLDPHRLAEFIRRSRLTQWFSVPSILSYMARFDVVRHGDFPELRRLLWCGEVFPTPSLMHYMQRLPHVAFTNLYGPTEATIASSFYTVPRCPEDEATAVPIGQACAGEELLVLDEALQPLPPGQAGDLYIAGVGLSPGYWRDPERTGQVFVPDPRRSGPDGRLYRTGDVARLGKDGLVYFLGRRDDQIKSRGYRIELGEIESALAGLPGLREAVVVALPTGGFEGTAIACAYVPVAGSAVSPTSLRKDLGRALPAYMVPSRWMALETLPRNANGKVDRKALKERFASVGDGRAMGPGGDARSGGPDGPGHGNRAG
jgi:amino acid adenylation domain-containing protein